MSIVIPQIPKISRKIDSIFLHASATRANIDDNITTADADIGVKEITQWHKERGFKSIGYHAVIRRNGAIELGRPWVEVGAHAANYNANSFGLVMVGGVDAKNNAENNYRPEQFDSIVALLHAIREVYPKNIIRGHNEVANKACPCFDVPTFCRLFHIERDTR